MASVGFTTANFYRSPISFDESIKLCHSLGAKAIELSFPTLEELFDYKLSAEKIGNIKKFESVSIHAPSDKVRYDVDIITQKIIETLSFFCDKLPIKWIVLHPSSIDNFEILDKSGLPFLLENMDKTKSCGVSPQQFRELKDKYNFGFVFDAQHAYEHDPSMKIAKELIDVMWNRLKHMHISGYNELEIHAPVHCAINKESITEILKLGLNVPKILEWAPSNDIKNSIIKELMYVMNYEAK